MPHAVVGASVFLPPVPCTILTTRGAVLPSQTCLCYAEEVREAAVLVRLARLVVGVISRSQSPGWG